MAIFLQTKNLTKKYKKSFAVHNVNITIDEGDIYGLIGKNGAGKTTLMKLMLGLINPTSGEYLYEQDENSIIKKKIGSVIESPSIFPSCSAFENLKHYSLLFGGNDEDIKRILDIVGLKNCSKKAKNFSLGMKQRLGIAIALLGHPRFLVLDEPINGLDPEGVIEIRDLILTLNKTYNITFLISSHILDELSKVATKIGILDNGILIDEISSKELLTHCNKKLRIVVDEPVKACELLKQTVNENDITCDGESVYLQSSIQHSAELNKLLCENGLLVHLIEVQSETLEQYFFKKVGKNDQFNKI